MKSLEPPKSWGSQNFLVGEHTEVRWHGMPFSGLQPFTCSMCHLCMEFLSYVLQ